MAEAGISTSGDQPAAVVTGRAKPWHIVEMAQSGNPCNITASSTAPDPPGYPCNNPHPPAPILSSGQGTNSTDVSIQLEAARAEDHLCEATQPAAAPLSLTDLPAPWLQELPGALDSHARLALFRACRSMRDLMLSQSNVVRLTFPQHALQHEADAAQACLLLACHHATGMDVVLGDEGQAHTVITASTHACNFMSSAMATAGQGLAAIKVVHLQGLVLDALVPSWLATTCPHMTTLHLRTCHFPDLPSPSTTLPTCGQLKHLHLHSLPGDMEQPMFTRWQHQLHSLPGLVSVSLGRGPEVGRMRQLALLARWLECCSTLNSTLGSQLTQLSFINRLHPVKVPAELPTWFPFVQDLSLTRLDDVALEVVLGMPSLKRLQVMNFNLQQSHTHRPCAWEQLRVQNLPIDSFVRLPLKRVRSFHIAAPERLFMILPSSILELNTQAVDLITSRGGLQGGDKKGDILVLGDDVVVTSAGCMAAVLPLLSNCKATSLTFECVPMVGFEFLAAMVEHLPSTHLSHLHFENCGFDVDAWMLLLGCLPRSVQELHLSWPVASKVETSGLSEAFLTDMCVYADRPIRLKVEHMARFLKIGWEQRVQAAMAAVGHQHVQLSLDV